MEQIIKLKFIQILNNFLLSSFIFEEIFVLWKNIAERILIKVKIVIVDSWINKL